jgi:hypothetical protein
MLFAQMHDGGPTGFGQLSDVKCGWLFAVLALHRGILSRDGSR